MLAAFQPGARPLVARWDRGLLVLVAAFVLALPLWTPRLYAVDSVEYFAYLPSLWLDHDLDFTNEYRAFDARNPQAGIAAALIAKTDPDTHRPINVAPIGTAILWTPAWAATHLALSVAHAAGAAVTPDGVSQPYIWAVCLAALLYGLGGLVFSYQIARRWAGVWPATAATLAGWLATPVLFYSYVSPPWSHAPALFMTAWFVWYWLRVRPAPRLDQWLNFALLGGLMTLCREQLGLWLVLPALDALVAYAPALRARRWEAVGRLLAAHALFVAVVGLLLVPQLLTYRALTGHLRPSSHVAGKLEAGWYSPHFFDTLFDPTHGAFWWTPVWLVGLVGLALLWRRDRRVMLGLLLAFAAQVYINGSLGTTWHLTASFGFRRLIEATPVFVLGLALLIERSRWPRPLVVGLGALLVAWNLGLILQWSLPPRPIRDGLVWDGMLGRQSQVVTTTVGRLDQLLFRRCELVKNGGC